VRTGLGQLLGRTHVYSALNADAARAVRLQEQRAARRIAARAGELERSPSAAIIRQAMHAAAARMASEPMGPDAPVALQRYCRLRARSSWRGLEQQHLAREWLVHSAAWLEHDEHGELVRAVTELARAAQEARAELLADGAPALSTFFGVVKRMDAVAAEVEGDSGTRLVPRDELERRGLATLGQPVALLCEALPAGGSLVFAMPAVMLDARDPARLDPWNVEGLDEGGVLASRLSARDHAWIERELTREPSAVPVAPLRRA